MNILLLANKLPYPANDGSSIAVARMIEGFIANGISLTVLALNTKKHHKDPADIPAHVRAYVTFHSVDVDTNPSVGNAFLNLFQRLPFHVSRFFQKKVATRLEALLKETDFDVVQAEGLFMMPYKRLIWQNSKAKLVLRAHNIEHLIWKRAAENQTKPILKQFLRAQAHKLKRYETYCARIADAVLPISPVDAQFFSAFNQRVHTVPCGVDVQPLMPVALAPNRFFHLGAMDWLPNQQGVQWLIQHVWPLVYAKNANLELHLAGRAMPQWLLNVKSPGITVHGEVAHAKTFRQAHGVMLVPLLAGSGLRIKIIEGLAEGLPIISTAIGAEGIHAVQGESILIANTADAFAAAMLALTNDMQRCAEIGKNAATLAAKTYQNKEIIADLAEFYTHTWQ